MNCYLLLSSVSLSLSLFNGYLNGEERKKVNSSERYAFLFHSHHESPSWVLELFATVALTLRSEERERERERERENERTNEPTGGTLEPTVQWGKESEKRGRVRLSRLFVLLFDFQFKWHEGHTGHGWNVAYYSSHFHCQLLAFCPLFLLPLWSSKKWADTHSFNKGKRFQTNAWILFTARILLILYLLLFILLVSFHSFFATLFLIFPWEIHHPNSPQIILLFPSNQW